MLPLEAVTRSSSPEPNTLRKGGSNRRPYGKIACLVLATSSGLSAAPAVSRQVKSEAGAGGVSAPATRRDGERDFDFDIGTWKTHLRRLVHPLTGSTVWVEYDGATVVRKIWDGRANLAELVADGPAGHLEVLSLRLYNPEAHQWSLNSANVQSGTISVPTAGEFQNGRGEFFDQETINGRAVLVRNVWTDITPTSCRFEQSFSEDGGKTWELNWVAVDTRVDDDDVKHP
jgi:hypothetical protein